MDLVIYFDGACNPNPGPGSYGWHIGRYGDGDEWLPIAKGRGNCEARLATNNVAEWEGLIAALEWVGCLDPIPDSLLIRGDSNLVIEQLCGRWKAKKVHLAILRDLAWRILDSIGCKWKAEWVPREWNKIADKLSKESSV